MRLVPPLSAPEKEAVVLAARALLTADRGAPVRFRHQGRTLKGLDCIGVIVHAFTAAGFNMVDRTDYGRMPAQRKLAESLAQHFGPPVLQAAPVKPVDLQVGDVVAMAWGDEEAHVGLVVDHPYGVGIIHAYAIAKRVIEHRIDPLVASKIVGVYRP